MREVTKIGFQGDCAFIRIDKIPDGLKEMPKTGDHYVVAHSETGHHHTLAAKAARVWLGLSALELYIQVLKRVEVLHHRPVDQHQPLVLLPGNYQVKRQQEYTPQGWRRVED